MRAKALADRFTEVVLNGKLIAFTNIQEQLRDVTMEQATQKIGSLNTLAALTFHLNYYIAGVLQVYLGGDLTIRDKYSFDMEPIATEEDWNALRDSFLSHAASYAEKIAALSDEVLDSPFVKEAYGSHQKNINAMIEHCYYHFGQMVIIKKLVLEQQK